MTTFDPATSASDSLAFTPAQARWYLDELLPAHTTDEDLAGIASWLAHHAHWPIERIFVVLPALEDHMSTRTLLRLAAHLAPGPEALLVLIPSKRRPWWFAPCARAQSAPGAPALLAAADESGLTLSVHQMQPLLRRHIRAIHGQWGRRTLRAGLLVVQWSRR